MTKRLLVACHDAGGAEVVSAWVRRHLEEWRVLPFVLDGPAVDVFTRKFERCVWMRFMQEGLERRDVDLLLCGSSGKAPLERDAVRWAHSRGIPSAVYLDHWKFYVDRFDLLPDEVWVCDDHAAALAREKLPGANVVVKGNFYLEDMAAEIRKLKYARAGREHVLFVHEPGRQREFQRWLTSKFRNGQVLRERPHPSLGPTPRTLAEDVAWADVVVGCDSMALVVALAAGRRAVSVLPRGEVLHLPQEEIERLYLGHRPRLARGA